MRHMSKSNGSHRIIWWTLLGTMIAAMWSSSAVAQIAVDGRYWSYNGQRVLLLGGWNHGHNPFIDHDTDNDRDKQGVSTEAQIIGEMDELVEAGGNYLRCVLDPGMAAGIQGFDFCDKTDGKYDLNTMTGPFWTRLEMFISEANKREIIVQIELWDRFDWFDGGWGSWPVSPWNPENNVNYTTDSSGLATSYGSVGQHPFFQGVPGYPEYETASASRKKQFDVVRGFQEKFVEKLLSITLAHGNVLYCMNNETDAGAAWGRHWMKFIESRAQSQGKTVMTTDMFNDVYKIQDSRGLTYQLDHRSDYDYIDVSQSNSRYADEAHWEAIRWIAAAARKVDPPYLLHMTKVYGNDLALDGEPWSSWRPGDSDNAIEEWWRDLLAGVAGIRFHRPTAGLGLCDATRNCLRATRKVESQVRFWEVEPRLDLLTDRDADEAYLAANPGQAYILYFTQNGPGSVALNLTEYADQTFTLRWVNVTTGNWGPSTTVSGGRTICLTRPNPEAHWVATLAR